MQVLQGAEDGDLEGLPEAQLEVVLGSPGVDGLKLVQTALNFTAGGRVQVIPGDAGFAPHDDLTLVHQSRPDVGQDVRVNALIERPGI